MILRLRRLNQARLGDPTRHNQEHGDGDLDYDHVPDHLLSKHKSDQVLRARYACVLANQGHNGIQEVHAVDEEDETGRVK